MSVDEFLRSCFLKLLKARTDLTDATIGGIRVQVPRPRLNSVVGQRYTNTQHARTTEPRYPLLCKHAHHTWTEGASDIPRPMEVNFGGNTLSRVRELLENGDNVPGAHFKHWRRNDEEKDAGLECFCGQNELLTPETRKQIRQTIYGIRSPQAVCFFPRLDHDTWSGDGVVWVHPLAIGDVHQQEPIQIDNRGSFEQAVLSCPHLSCLSSPNSPLIWLSSGENSQLPRTAHLLIFPLPDGERGVSLPENGTIYLHFSSQLGEILLPALQRLVNDVGHEGVQAFSSDNGLLESLWQESEAFVAKVEWSDPNSYSQIKSFVKDLTGLQLSDIRQSSALRLDVFDSNFNHISALDANDRTLYKGLEYDEYLIRIRRGRNIKIESFYLNLGAGIELGSTTPFGSRVRITDLDPEKDDAERLYEIYLDVPLRDPLQRALWLKLKIADINDASTWLEVFDFGSSVESSGQRIRFIGGGPP
jgi:hypothetical protein